MKQKSLSPITQSILDILDTKDYVSEMELSKLTSHNSGYICNEVNKAISEGLLAVCGELYSDRFKKNFRLITKQTYRVTLLQNAIEKKQYTTQRNQIIEELMDSYLSSCNIQPMQDQLDFIKKQHPKINPKYFRLSEFDVSKIYEAIIRHGAGYKEWRKDERNDKKKMPVYFIEKGCF